MRQRLSTALLSSIQHISTLAVVAIYVTLVFSIASAWSYLSAEANAFVSDAQRIDREELADTVRFQMLASEETKHKKDDESSGKKNVGVTPDESALPEGGLACGAMPIETCEELRMLLPQ